jgi:imidazolonepropionase
VIVAVGEANAEDYEVVVEAQDLCLLPGLEDAHTHALFSGDRCHEFKTYLDIHQAGGGIIFTVNHVRANQHRTSTPTL